MGGSQVTLSSDRAASPLLVLCLIPIPAPFSGILKAIEAGNDVNEVEAAGNTPLHSCCYEGWLEGAKLLLDLGAKVIASNNAGDRPIHWAQNMGHDDLEKFLKENGADESQGGVLVPDHVPKVKDFFEKECWAHHPLPHR